MLSKEVEQPLSRLCADLQEYIDNGVEYFELAIEKEKLLKKYVITSLGRSEAVIREVISKSTFGFLFSEQTQHDFTVKTSFGFADTTKNPYNDYHLGIYVNQSTREFVIPRNCFYVNKNKQSLNEVIAPISPRIALVLLPPECCDVNPLLYDCRLREIEDSRIIDSLNKCALISEFYQNGEFVAASRQDELLDLQAWLLEHFDEMKKAREKEYGF